MASSYPFPVATHSYLTVRNKRSARRLFLQSPHEEPVFSYGSQFSEKLVRERLKKVPVGSREADALSLVLCSILLQNDSAKLSEFRKANLVMFPRPKKEYVMAILNRLETRVEPEDKKLWREVLTMTGELENASSVAPSKEQFEKYRQYRIRYIHSFSTKGLSIAELLRKHIELSGLAEKGWKVKVRRSASAARTNHESKWISIGEKYQPRTIRAKKRIVIHEVYGHALRGQQPSVAESEGFAIVLEQLVGPHFTYRRAYRYLAVALGWGVLGRPMTFHEVFEILWRVMMIGSEYSKKSAKQHAFDECRRAFRGGRPDIAGAVHLKDAVYFDGNIAMWNALMKQELSYNEFVDVIEGRRTLLS